MMDATTMPCRVCEETGRIEVRRCAEIDGGWRCKNPRRDDPEYFLTFPDRKYVKPYCGMHGNARRSRQQQQSDSEGA